MKLFGDFMKKYTNERFIYLLILLILAGCSGNTLSQPSSSKPISPQNAAPVYSNDAVYIPFSILQSWDERYTDVSEQAFCLNGNDYHKIDSWYPANMSLSTYDRVIFKCSDSYGFSHSHPEKDCHLDTKDIMNAKYSYENIGVICSPGRYSFYRNNTLLKVYRIELNGSFTDITLPQKDIAIKHCTIYEGTCYPDCTDSTMKMYCGFYKEDQIDECICYKP